MRPSYGTPDKLQSLNYDSSKDDKETGISKSVDRHQRSLTQRQRRQQIIAKLASKRKQYQTGIIHKFKPPQRTQREPHEAAKTNQPIKPTKPMVIIQNETEEKEEQKSGSVSTSLSISPIQPQNNYNYHNNHNHKTHETSKQTLNLSKSPSNSPYVSPHRKNNEYLKSLSHHQNAEDYDSSSDDERDEEIKMLKAQNQRLSNKLEHVNGELNETQVFLRSERKRNKNLSHQMKLKEDEVHNLLQQIDDLEAEIEEKDKKCVECVEKLSDIESKFEQQSKTLTESQSMNHNLSEKIKKSYAEIKEWSNKYYDIFENFSFAKSQHKQQMTDLQSLQHELNQRDLSQTDAIKQLKEIINAKNSEIESNKRQNRILINAIHLITKIMQTHTKSNDNNNTDYETVSKQLNAMLSNIIEVSDNKYSFSSQHSNDEMDTQCIESERDIHLLLQSLIAVIEKSDRFYQQNQELTACLNKYEDEVVTLKNTIIGYKDKFQAQQDRLQTLQENFTCLTKEKVHLENKCGETTKELQVLYEKVYTATDTLQTMVVQVTDDIDIGDIEMGQCIEIIRGYIHEQRIKTNKLYNALSQLMTKHEQQMKYLQEIFRNGTSSWSEKISVLQDRLSDLQIQLLRGNESTNSSNISNMSMVSDVLNKSFYAEDISSQFQHQMVLINELKDELTEKEKMIENLYSKQQHIQQSKYDEKIKELYGEMEQIQKERDEAVDDFQCIAQEWKTMEKQMDDTFTQNEALMKRLKDIHYWIDYMVDNVNQRVIQEMEIDFESMADKIPKGLKKLYSTLKYMLCRIPLHGLNETTMDTLNDTMLLENLFGKIDHNEDTQLVEVKEEDAESVNHGEKESLMDNVSKLEAEICLESILHKIELNHIGQNAEQIIAAQQDRLQKYGGFIKQLQSKCVESSKLIQSMSTQRDTMAATMQATQIELDKVKRENETLKCSLNQNQKNLEHEMQVIQKKYSELAKATHSISLERDHAWKQYQTLQTEVEKLLKENEMLQSSLSENEQILKQNKQELQHKTEQLNQLMEQNEIQIDSVKRQLKLNEDTNINIHNRLQETTLMLQETTKQRDELHQRCQGLQKQCGILSNKFMEYKNTSDTLFKRSCHTMVESLNPLMAKLNQYSILSQRLECIGDKVKYLKDYMKNNAKNKEQEKDNEIEAIRKQCEKSAISKLRMHADIHRFQFAKLLQQMKQKYCAHIEELQARITCLQDKFTKIQDSYSTLQNQFEEENQEKIMIESQLLQLKKSFNEEVVNYQNVQNGNKEREKKLNDIINDLQQQLDEKNIFSHNIASQNQINIKKRAELQEKLNDQTKKAQKIHTKAVKLQSELKTMTSSYNDLQQRFQQIQHENKDYKLQFDQLEALNASLKEALNTKDINHKKMNEIYDSKLLELKEALANVEHVNNALNDKSELQQEEIQQYIQQIQEMESITKTNRDYADKIETLKNDRLHDEREWLQREEDLRDEISVLRKQAHETTNDLGMMKLDILEKETFIKKLQNEINGLNEEILFYKECELKDRNERELLTEQISQHNKTHEKKMDDIKMILDAKGCRILRLQEEVEEKTQKIKELETEIIALQNEVSTAQSMMNEEQSTLQQQNHENNKLQSIINDLSSELKSIKNERGKLFSELETQKTVNVQLSLELDSMQKFIDKSDLTANDADNDDINIKVDRDMSALKKSLTDDDLNKYSFFDADLENRDHFKPASSSMPNMDDDDDQNDDVDDEILRNLNLRATTLDDSDIQSIQKLPVFHRKRPGLPIPKHVTSMSASTLSTRRGYKQPPRTLYGGNAEENDSV